MNFAKQSGHNGTRLDKTTPRKSISNTPSKTPDTTTKHTRRISASQQNDLFSRLSTPKTTANTDTVTKLNVPRSTTIQRKSLQNTATTPVHCSRTQSVSHTPATPVHRTNSIVSPSRIPILSPIDVQRSTTLHSARSNSIQYTATTPSQIPRLSSAKSFVLQNDTNITILHDSTNTPPRDTPAKKQSLSNSSDSFRTDATNGVVPLSTTSSVPIMHIAEVPAVENNDVATGAVDSTVAEPDTAATVTTTAAVPQTSATSDYVTPVVTTGTTNVSTTSFATAPAAPIDEHLHTDLDKFDVDISLDDETESVQNIPTEETAPIHVRQNSVEMLRKRFELPSNSVPITPVTTEVQPPVHNAVDATVVPAVNATVAENSATNVVPVEINDTKVAASSEPSQSTNTDKASSILPSTDNLNHHTTVTNSTESVHVNNPITDTTSIPTTTSIINDQEHDIPTSTVPHKRHSSSSSLDLGLDDVTDSDELLNLSSPQPQMELPLAIDTPMAVVTTNNTTVQQPHTIPETVLDLLSDDEHHAVNQHLAGLDSTINSPLASLHNTHNLTNVVDTVNTLNNTVINNNDTAVENTATNTTEHTDPAVSDTIDTKPITDTIQSIEQPSNRYINATSPSDSTNPLSNVSQYVSPADSQHNNDVLPHTEADNTGETQIHTDNTAQRADSIDLGFDGLDSPLNDDLLADTDLVTPQPATLTPATLQQLVQNNNVQPNNTTPTTASTQQNNNNNAVKHVDEPVRKYSNSRSAIRTSVSIITNVKSPAPVTPSYNELLQQLKSGVHMLKIPRSGSKVKSVLVKLIQDTDKQYSIQWHSDTKQLDDTSLPINDCILVLGQTAGVFGKDKKWKQKYSTADTRSMSIIHLKRSLDLILLDQSTYDNVVTVLRALPFKNIEGK